MDFFDKHKALIITSLLFGILILSLHVLSLSNNNQSNSEMLVDLEQFKATPEEKTTPKDEAPRPKNRRKIQTHKAYNENEEQREADFNDRLNEIFDKNSAQQEEAENEETSGSDGNYRISKKNSTEKRKASEGNDNSEETGQKSAVYDYSSISFSLKDRRAVRIPNPVYTCDMGGKVVINIEVDESGRVTDVGVNKGSSNTSNECIINKALEYAREARFTKLAGQNDQPGTITYYFKS